MKHLRHSSVSINVIYKYVWGGGGGGVLICEGSYPLSN